MNLSAASKLCLLYVGQLQGISGLLLFTQASFYPIFDSFTLRGLSNHHLLLAEFLPPVVSNPHETRAVSSNLALHSNCTLTAIMEWCVWRYDMVFAFNLLCDVSVPTSKVFIMLCSRPGSAAHSSQSVHAKHAPVPHFVSCIYGNKFLKLLSLLHIFQLILEVILFVAYLSF